MTNPQTEQLDNRREKFWEWLYADPDDVGPQDFLRMLGHDDLVDYAYAIDPETLERLRQEIYQLHCEFITGRLNRKAEEYETRWTATLEPLQANLKLVLAIDGLLS